VRFRLLGPLEVRDGAGWLAIRSAQQRTVLAVLLIEAGRTVTTDRLVDEIWGERPPRTAVNALHGYVMRLRQLLGGRQTGSLAGPIVTVRHGYQLLAEEDDLDATMFDRLVESGKQDLTRRRLRAGAARLAEALALWRGPAFADVPASPTVATAVQWFEQRRLTAVEDRIDADLELGRHAEVVDELYRLTGATPLRERLLAQLMLALFRCGRRSEALDAYRAGSRALMDELGVRPGARLRELERMILADDKVVAPVTRAVPAQLPADVAGFTGRSSYLRELDHCVSDGSHLTILTITGTAGVGKTALAVHWAHRVRHRFPDGQLYVNLRGYASGTPLRPIDVLTSFLLVLGVSAEDIPLDESLAAAEFRTRLTDTRTLVVLDNAGDADQVRPLLPGSSGCLVVVTSRDRLPGLVALDGGIPLAVDVLTDAESLTLLRRLLDDRVAAEPEAATELIGLCGRLPLALRIVAANLLVHPTRKLADHVTRLRTGDRLGELEVGGDRQTGVRTAIDHSYAAQPAPARRLFRLLGLVPGPDVTVVAAAALAGVTTERAAELLDQLTRAHLVDEDTVGRYTMHDLLRCYAAERAAAVEGDAVRLLLHHYLASADTAARMLYPEKLRLPVPHRDGISFTDNDSAMAWLDAERINLVAAIHFAADHEFRMIACLLADTLRGYFDMRMYTVDWLAAARTGLHCAELARDLRAQAAARLSLALLDWKQSRYPQAIEHYMQALNLTEREGWLAGHAAALGNLGKVYADLGRLELAAVHYGKALAIDRRTGDRIGQAIKLGNLGEVHLCLGRLDDAMAMLTEALTLHRQAGSRGSESIVLRGLALVHREVGNAAEALQLAGEAVAVARGIGGQRQLAKALNALATIHHDAGNNRLAAAAHQEALVLARDRGDRCGEIEALTGLATISNNTDYAAEAVVLARQTGARAPEARALTALAQIHLANGRPQDAITTARTALAIHAETGQQLCVARTELLLSQALRTSDDEQRRTIT
jgi:DNA-binding SARP family transcriptional activator/tetratricopeptide (TPR) repeat protein